MDGEVQVIHFLMHTLAPAEVSTASYWVGVLLTCGLSCPLGCFGLNSTNEPSVSLLAITTVDILLLIQIPHDTHAMVHPNGTGKCIRFWGGSYYIQEVTSLSLSLEMQCLPWEVCMFYHFPFLSS